MEAEVNLPVAVVVPLKYASVDVVEVVVRQHNRTRTMRRGAIVAVVVVVLVNRLKSHKRRERAINQRSTKSDKSDKS